MALLSSLASHIPQPQATIAANDNRRPAGRLERGVLTLALEVREGLLRPEGDSGPGIPALAFAEVGKPPQVPGPLIRVPQGTEIRVRIRNPFPDSTLTVYGLTTHPTAGDSGVGIGGRATREFRFRADLPGTYYYWASTTGAGIDRQWFESQLTGALVVDPPNASTDDRVFVIGAWFRAGDSSLAVPRPTQEVMVINGRSWPNTERLSYTQGDSVRWRWINASGVSHPMHLHGFYFQVESRGDWRSERVYRGEERPLVVTDLMLPGQTMRIGWQPRPSGKLAVSLSLRVSRLAPHEAPRAPCVSCRRPRSLGARAGRDPSRHGGAGPRRRNRSPE